MLQELSTFVEIDIHSLRLENNGSLRMYMFDRVLHVNLHIHVFSYNGGLVPVYNV